MKFTCSVMVGLVLGGAATILSAREQPPNTQQAAEQKAVNLCSSCHGPRGISTSPEFPVLAAQREAYTIRQLEAFAKKTRANKDAHDYMWGIAGQLDEGTIARIARYYALQLPAPGRSERLALAIKGEEVFEGGAPDRGIPPCAACHGHDAEGVGEFPRLAGQHAKYIAKQVGLIQTHARPTAVKHDFIKDLTSEETQAVAAYVQSK
jgi:cytochrome c553